MSSNRTDKPPRGGSASASAAGFSLLEVVIASSLLIAMLYAVSNLVLSGTDASDLSRRSQRASELGQAIVDEMRLELVSSLRIFGDDIEGQENLATFDLTGAPTPLADLRLPVIDVNGTVRADTSGNEITGNTLFFCKLAWTDRFVCSSTNEYLVDVVRWIYYYLTPEGGGPRPGSPLGLNLVRVVSEPLVDATGVDRIADPVDRAEVLLHLLNATPDVNGVTHAPCELVWDRGRLPSVAGTIRQIDPATGALSSIPLAPRTSPFRVERRDPGVGGVLYYKHFSVASNYSQPSFGVGAFALPTTAGAGFPHGFEVQAAGPTSARKVLIHLVIASTNNRGLRAWSDVQVVIDTREM